MSKRKSKRKVNTRAIAGVLAGFAFLAVILTVGSVSGSFLLDSTNPPQTEQGWVFGALLPIGTNVDIDGVDFQVNYDGSEFYLYEDGAIQDRGRDMTGNNVEVHILDWWFYGMPTHSGIYLANIRVSRPILNITGPIFRPAELDAFGDAASDLITQDGELTLQVRNYTINVATDSDMRPMSVVILMIAALEGSGRVAIDIDWGEGTVTRESFNLDADITRPNIATPEGQVGDAIYWCPELHSKLVSSVIVTVYYEGQVLTSFDIENPLVKLASGLDVLASGLNAAGEQISAGFESVGESFESIENQFQDFEEQTAEAIETAWNTMYDDVLVLRKDLESQLINTQEWTEQQLASLQANTEGAMQGLADTFTRQLLDLDRRFTIITQRLADPQIQVYAPPVWSSGLPNSLSIEAQNATVTGVSLTDDSGSLWDELTTSLSAVPLEGDQINLEIEYEATFPAELWGLEESHASTTTLSFLVNHQTGFYVDLSGNTGFSGALGGLSIIHVIIIAGAVAGSLIVLIVGRGRGWF